MNMPTCFLTFASSQAPPASNPLPPGRQSTAADDEAYARQLQEQFDRENAPGNPTPAIAVPQASRPTPAPFQAAPPPRAGGSWRRRFDKLSVTAPEDLCRGCKEPIGNALLGGRQWIVALGGKWHPGQPPSPPPPLSLPESAHRYSYSADDVGLTLSAHLFQQNSIQ